jgi:hypothetical protein
MYRPIATGIQELVWRKGDERCQRSYQKQVLAAPPTLAVIKEEPRIQRVAEPSETESFRQVSSKREEANAKINSRYLVGSATQNPFMPSNNYVNDIEVQLSYLTPQKS